MNRTIYIGNPAYLKCSDKQMKIIEPSTKELKGSIPIEDIAFLVLDHPQITLSHHLMIQLQSERATIISCDAQHIPMMITTPLFGHSEHTERLLLQKEISEPLKKNLWKQTIECKIHNQARLLERLNLPTGNLLDWMTDVKSGDTTNREGIAAKYYWEQMFEEFNRERYGDVPNNFLNFGYAILRSVVARALSSSGFHLAMGIHHKSKYNATCLADDIMEPYRPYVDELVYEYRKEYPHQEELTKDVKARLLTLMQKDVRIDGKTRPLQVAVTITTASLYKCYIGEMKLVRYPLL